MKARSRHLLSLLMTAIFVSLAYGSTKPSAQEEKRRAEEQKAIRGIHDDWLLKVGAAYGKLLALDKSALGDKPCDGAALLAAAKQSGYISIPTVYGPYMARFASSNKADWKPDDGPWAFLTESTFRGHFERHPGDRDDYAIDGTGRMIKNDWLANRFLIVLWPEDETRNRLPAVNEGKKTFQSGLFVGWALVVDPIEGTVACQKKLSIENSESVRSRNTFLDNPEKAIRKDFEDQLDAAVKGALPPNVKSSNNMGSVLK